MCQSVDDQHIISKHADHVLTSSSIALHVHSKVAESTVQVDPRTTAIHMKGNQMNAASLQKVKKNKYPQMGVRKTTSGFKLENPPFGSDCKIIAGEERKLGGYVPDLAKLVERRNEVVKAGMLTSQLAQMPQGGDYIKFNIEYTEAVKKINKLYELLLVDLSSSTDTTFKNAAGKLIGNSNRQFRDITDPTEFLHKAPPILLALGDDLKKLLHGKQNDTLDDMIVKIQYVADFLPSSKEKGSLPQA